MVFGCLSGLRIERSCAVWQGGTRQIDHREGELVVQQWVAQEAL